MSRGRSRRVALTSISRTGSSGERDELIDQDDTRDHYRPFFREDADGRRRSERKEPRNPSRAGSLARLEIGEQTREDTEGSEQIGAADDVGDGFGGERMYGPE